MNFLNATTTWHGLSAANKGTWALAAAQYPQIDRLGKRFFMSGFNLFVKNYVYAVIQGGTIQAAAPNPLVYSPIVTCTAAYSTGGATFNVTWTLSGGSYPSRVQVYGFRGFNRQTNYTPKNYKFFFAGTPTATPNPTNLKTTFDAVFGAPVVGETIWIKTIPNNLVSYLAPPFYTRLVVT